jgi:hypothetical protein
VLLHNLASFLYFQSQGLNFSISSVFVNSCLHHSSTDLDFHPYTSHFHPLLNLCSELHVLHLYRSLYRVLCLGLCLCLATCVCVSGASLQPIPRTRSDRESSFLTTALYLYFVIILCNCLICNFTQCNYKVQLQRQFTIVLTILSECHGSSLGDIIAWPYFVVHRLHLIPPDLLSKN